MLSMTGQGIGQASDQNMSVSVELRSVNSRFLKINFSGADCYHSISSELENSIRETIRRGTVNVHLRVDGEANADSYQINTVVLESYQRQLCELTNPQPVELGVLLNLPGVITENTSTEESQKHQQDLIKSALAEAIQKLQEMRQREGESMAVQLAENCQQIAERVEQIKERSPVVVDSYAERLQERINQMLEKMDLKIDRKDIVREIGIFSDRCDVNEEVVRLKSHLEQFGQIIQSENCSGRKLDFLTQELLREANTIGSKSNDAEIAGHVVEMKTAIERIREMVQNVE